MKKPGRDDKVKKASAGAKPPADAVPLRNLVWAHPTITDAVDEALRRYFEPTPPYVEFVDDDYKVPDEYQFFTQRSPAAIECFVGQSRRPMCTVLHAEFSEGECGNWRIMPVWAAFFWRKAIQKFKILWRKGELQIVGRWGSFRAPFEIVPLDAWPRDEDVAHAAGRLDYDAGRLTLDTGEIIFSVHIVPSLPMEPSAERPSRISATVGAETRFARAFRAEVEQSPNCRTITKPQLIARALAAGLSERAGIRVWNNETGYPPEIKAVWQAQGRPKKNPAPKT